MRFKLTLTLLAILLGLLTYIFYIDTRNELDPYEEKFSSVLGDLAVGIDYLSIRNNATGQNITLENENNRWMLKEPYLWPANEFAVQRILTELRFLERVSSFETNVVSNSGVSLTDYGLRPSQTALMIGRGERKSTLHIGKPTEIGNNLYILSTDQEYVHVVNRSLLDAITINLDTLRSSRLFDIAVFEATSWNIQVREDDRNLRAWFARNGNNWVFETPIRARADSGAVNGLLNRCLSLEADAIVAPSPSDLSPYGLQNPLYRIAVEAAEQREVLEIGEKISDDSEFRYAKRESRPSVFQLRIDFLDLLANAQTKLRERRILELDATAATTVTINRRNQEPLTLQKLEDGNWELVVRDESNGIETMEGDTQSISEILKWLNELKAVPDSGFVNDAPSDPDLESYGLEVPEFSITLTSNKLFGEEETLETLETETLFIGDRTPESRQKSFVKIDKKTFVYSVYNDIFTRIDTDPILYKNRKIIDLPETSQISHLTVERLADRAILIDEEINPNTESPNVAARLAGQISELSIEAFNPDGFTRTVSIAGRQQPWAYKAIATVRSDDTLEAISQKIEIFISEASGGPLLYGGIAESNQGFRFRTDFIDTFSEIVFDRTQRNKPEDPFSPKPLPENQATPSNEERFEAETPDQPTAPSE